MKHLLLIMVAITLICLMVMGGAFAALSDTEIITGNSITAGDETMEDEGLTHYFCTNDVAIK